jgi:hypothetical protein
MINRHLYPDDPNYPASKRLWVKDPVDGGKVLKNSSRDILFEWCDKNCSGRYWVGMGFIDFELVSDYTLAILSLSTVDV